MVVAQADVSDGSNGAAGRCDNDVSFAKSPVLTWRRSPVRIRPSPSFFLESDILEPFIKGFSDSSFMAKMVDGWRTALAQTRSYELNTRRDIYE